MSYMNVSSGFIYINAINQKHVSQQDENLPIIAALNSK